MTLKELRKRAGLTQEQVGDKMDVHQSAVSLWENGKWPPLRKCRQRLARLYGCTGEELEAALAETKKSAETK